MSELGIEEVKDVREFIREVPLFQGMMQAEEVEGEWGFIEGTSMQRASTIWPHSLLAMRGDYDGCRTTQAIVVGMLLSSIEALILILIVIMLPLALRSFFSRST